MREGKKSVQREWSCAIDRLEVAAATVAGKCKKEVAAIELLVRRQRHYQRPDSCKQVDSLGPKLVFSSRDSDGWASWYEESTPHLLQEQQVDDNISFSFFFYYLF